MKQELLINEIKDTLIRLEGTIKVMQKDPEVIAYRKIQGIRDKMQNLLVKLINENKEKESLTDKIKQKVGENDSN